MSELTEDFLNIMHRFRRLNLFSLLPLSRQDYMVLATIRCLQRKSSKKLRVSAVARDMEVVTPAVSRSLKNLESQGFVKRTVSPTDRRNIYVALTEKGGMAMVSYDAILAQFHKRVVEQMSAEEMQRLLMLLERMYAISESQLAQMKREEQEK